MTYFDLMIQELWKATNGGVYKSFPAFKSAILADTLRDYPQKFVDALMTEAVDDPELRTGAKLAAGEAVQIYLSAISQHANN